jgi:uncharacterized protein (TIGR00369 family)
MTQPMTLQELQRQIDEPPYHQFLRPVAVSIDPQAGEVVLRLPFRPEFQRSPDRPELHGGVTSALIDLAGDYALAARLGYGVPTINLRVDYLSMAVDTDLTATARIVRAGRMIGIADIEVTDKTGKLIAVGRGTYSTRQG